MAARGVLTILFVILASLGLLVGAWLSLHFGQLPQRYLTIVLLFVLGLFVNDFLRKKRSYFYKKFSISMLCLLNSCLWIWIGNQAMGNPSEDFRLFAVGQCGGISAQMYAPSPPQTDFKEKIPHKKSHKQAKKQLKKKLKDILLKTKKMSLFLKILLSAVLYIIILTLFTAVMYIACDLSCAGYDTLAALVGIVGALALAALGVWLYKLIWKPRNRPPTKKAKKESTNQT